MTAAHTATRRQIAPLIAKHTLTFAAAAAAAAAAATATAATATAVSAATAETPPPTNAPSPAAAQPSAPTTPRVVAATPEEVERLRAERASLPPISAPAGSDLAEMLETLGRGGGGASDPRAHSSL